MVGRVTRRVIGDAVEVIGPDGYRTPAWYEARRGTVSASEIAAVLGLSPYVSLFDLYWQKVTGESSQEENPAMRRGRRREAAIIGDFLDVHPEFRVEPVGLVVNRSRPWQAATPDGVVYESNSPRRLGEVTEFPVGVVEAKTDAGGDGWGADGTDEIPVHYRCQVMWQLDTLGLTSAFVPVWHGFGYTEHEITFDEGEALLMRTAAEQFLAQVEARTPPDPDAHTATRRRLSKLHPSLIDESVPVPEYLAATYYDAAARLKQAEADKAEAENRIRVILGAARYGTVGGVKMFTRSVYDVKERTQTVRGYTVNKIIPKKRAEETKE